MYARPRCAQTTRASLMMVIAAVSSGIGCIGTQDPDALTITPQNPEVLTCSVQDFFTNDTAAQPGWWSLSPWVSTGGIWGVAAPTGGFMGHYESPIVVPSPPQQTVSYKPASGATVSTTVHLATAHLGTPVAATGEIAQTSVPLEHAFSVSRGTAVVGQGATPGSRVYGVFPGPPADAGGYPHEYRVIRSDDGGATFGSPVRVPTDTLHCVSSATDAGNPDVLYVVHRAGTTGGEGHVRLAVSEDGGKTFPHEYTIWATDSGGADIICPDVTSPSANHVIVTGNREEDNTHWWVGAWQSGMRGAAASDTNHGHFTPCPIESDGEQRSPRVFSDGSHHVCMVYAVNPDSNGECMGGTVNVITQCSGDDGLTWSAPTVIGNSGPTKAFPTGAMSAWGAMAYTWTANVAGRDQVMVLTAPAFDKPLGTPKQYPLNLGLFEGQPLPSFPVVGWQSGGLWISMMVGDQILVDKSCDALLMREGLAWSGAVVLPPHGDFFGSSMIWTTRGMAVTGFGYDNGSRKPTTLFPLTP